MIMTTRTLTPMVVFWVFFITVLVFMAVSFAVGLWIGRLGISLTEVALIVPVLVYMRVRNIPMKPVFRLKFVPVRYFIISIMIGLSFSVLMDEFNRILDTLVIMDRALLEGLRQLMIWNSGSDAAFLIAGIVIFAPVCEEMLCRGFVQGSLQRYFGSSKALVLSAFCFTFIHFQPWYILQFFLFGILSGLLFRKTGSILPSICMHAFFNLYVLVVNNSDTSGITWYEFQHHVSPLCIAAAILILYTALKFLNIRNDESLSET